MNGPNGESVPLFWGIISPDRIKLANAVPLISAHVRDMVPVDVIEFFF